MHSVTKSYRDFPAAHRQPEHDGHCRLIHGHDWGFDITFTSAALDSCDFVVDVGKLKFVKEWLEEQFDHTLLLNESDPNLELLKDALAGGEFAKIVTVPNCGMEGLSKFVYRGVQALLSKHLPDDVSDRGLRVASVTCWEDSKNRALYRE